MYSMMLKTIDTDEAVQRSDPTSDEKLVSKVRIQHYLDASERVPAEFETQNQARPEAFRQLFGRRGLVLCIYHSGRQQSQASKCMREDCST